MVSYPIGVKSVVHEGGAGTDMICDYGDDDTKAITP